MRRIVLLGNVFAILSVIAGCSHLSKHAPLTLDRVTIAKIRQNLEQNNLRFRSMMAHAEISVESPKINFSAASKIILKNNDSLLVQVKAPFGIGAASIFIDKNQFKVYNSFENSLYYGDPQKINLRQFFPIDIKYENIFNIFSGSHLLDDFEKDSLAIDKNQYLIIARNKDQIQKYWIDPNKFVVTELLSYNATTKNLVRLECKQFEKTNNLNLPKLIQITQSDRKTRLTILYSDRKVNCKLNAEDFIFKVPDQVERIQL